MISFNDGEWEDSPRYKFLNEMAVFFKTPDYQNFLLINDSMFEDQSISAIINIDTMHNQMLGFHWSLLNMVLVRSITVRNDIRGLGFLGVICSMLQKCADKSGAFVCGVAKPFKSDLPLIQSKEELHVYFQGLKDEFETLKVDKQLKEKSIMLRDKYVEYGFCKYIGGGLRFESKFMKNNMFGYLPSKSSPQEHQSYFDRYLVC